MENINLKSTLKFRYPVVTKFRLKYIFLFEYIRTVKKLFVVHLYTKQNLKSFPCSPRIITEIPRESVMLVVCLMMSVRGP